MNHPEIHHLDEAIASLLEKEDSLVQTYFSEKELRLVAEEMIETIQGVLGKNDVSKVIFEDGDMMFFRHNDASIHLGMGVVRQMLETWFTIMTENSRIYCPPDIIKQKIQKSLRGDAAHEAGHRVIDRNPIDLGISQEEWGMLGISSLANALMDNRNDGRIMRLHPEKKPDMDAALEFSFGPGGRLDYDDAKDLLERGYVTLFSQFDTEIMRLWTYGVARPDADPRVLMLIEKEKEKALFVANDPSCVPLKKDPHDLEVRAKAQTAYRKIAEINRGEYQEKLVARDRENQAVHQAVSLVGLFKNEEGIPEKLKIFLAEELSKMPTEIAKELHQKLEDQQVAKKEYDARTKPVESLTNDTHEKVAGQIAGKPQKKEEKSYFEMLGPAVLVEKLSDELREHLKKLFTQMQELMQEEMMKKMLEDFITKLLENPEKVLKEIEDIFNEKIRPHTVPSMTPTHKEMEGSSTMPLKNIPKPFFKPGSQTNMVPSKDLVQIAPKELAEVEEWLEDNVDMKDRILAWREAIYSAIPASRKATRRPAPKLFAHGMVRDEIEKKLGLEPKGKIFLKKSPEREKIHLSVLWRTQAVPLKESLKLFLFLIKIMSDEEIRQYLDLEILISQKVPKLSSQSQRDSGVPVVMGFDQDALSDYDPILGNLLEIQKSGGGVSIVQDATAVKTQRERMLAHGAGGKKKFVIDFWDGAAIQSGVADPLAAVQKEIRKTQEILGGKAFCFLMNPGASPSIPEESYGKGHFLQENSTERLLTYLDIVVRSMVQYGENYTDRIAEQIDQI